MLLFRRCRGRLFQTKWRGNTEAAWTVALSSHSGLIQRSNNILQLMRGHYYSCDVRILICWCFYGQKNQKLANETSKLKQKSWNRLTASMSWFTPVDNFGFFRGGHSSDWELLTLSARIHHIDVNNLVCYTKPWLTTSYHYYCYYYFHDYFLSVFKRASFLVPVLHAGSDPNHRIIILSHFADQMSLLSAKHQRAVNKYHPEWH